MGAHFTLVDIHKMGSWSNRDYVSAKSLITELEALGADSVINSYMIGRP